MSIRGALTRRSPSHKGEAKAARVSACATAWTTEIEMIDLRGRTNLSKGYAAVFATVVIWSMPSLFQYYLNRYYDPWAQNFYRYSVACIAIAPLVFYRVRRGGPCLDRRALVLCLVPCFPNVVHQITQVMALFYMGPGVYAILDRKSVV